MIETVATNENLVRNRISRDRLPVISLLSSFPLVVTILHRSMYTVEIDLNSSG